MAKNPTQRTAGPKPQYSREKIVDVAVGLADADGIETVSVRSVASKLGTGPASLYRYVESYDQLTELMVDRISAEYDYEACSGSAIEQLLEIARQGRRIMSRHPWVPLIVMRNQVVTPNSLVYLERGLLALADTDLSAARKLHTLAMLNSITAAFALNDQSQRGQQDASALLNAMQMDSYPHLLLALSEINEPLDLDSAFEQAIVTYLRGVGVGKYPYA